MHFQDDPSRGKSATTRPYSRPKIKDPGSDPVIAMARDRRKKELAIEEQALIVSGLTGNVMHKELRLADLEKEHGAPAAVVDSVRRRRCRAARPPRPARGRCIPFAVTPLVRA